MARTPLIHVPDGAFHVMTHATDGAALFQRDADRKMYLGLLQLVVERRAWTLLSFVLMDNHLHLLATAKAKDLSAGLQWLHWRYAIYFKRTYEPHFGAVFGGRPRRKPIKDDAYLLAVARYIARNPVGVLCDRPDEHRWSAHRALLGRSAPLPMLARNELLGWFGPTGAIRQYEAFVLGADPARHDDVVRWANRPPEERPDLESVVASRTPTSYAEAHDVWGYSLRAIARAVGVSHPTILRAIGRVRT